MTSENRDQTTIVALAIREAIEAAEHNFGESGTVATMRDAATAVLAALSKAGYVIVQREPTSEMTEAGATAHTAEGACATDTSLNGYDADPNAMTTIWRAMVEAAKQ